MKAKAMTTVLVKLGNTNEYELEMDIVGIYPPDTDIYPLIDLDKETIVVTATVGMLSGYPLAQLKEAAEKCYISALQGYIKERWNVMSTDEKLRLINYILLSEVLKPSMSSEEMMRKIEQVSKDERDLYVTLVNAYEYTPD